ncbi:Fis family two component transcriptional regulator [Kushneria sinocarnis]|uniref:Fis family two component transcriptional regulator n=1 Tax=Kushneria sinocarnis TaxID=595502 RepID=A0A420WY46_9GAMM|nr:response regulator transcription factor [Kushneria sinocarnis]RKR06149.1 Fis family two component transcriptional regulator [Kushneria sinocarnis]
MTAHQSTFLIVDDDEFFCRVLERALTRREFDVRVAYTTEQALQVAREAPPEYATIDLKLSESSGLKLLPELLAISPDCRAIILTGYSSISTAVEAIKLGAVNYLCKPVDAPDVLHALDAEEGNPDAEIPDNPPSVNRLTWEHIQKVLHEHDGNISATARSLGMHRRTLQRKLQKRPVKR